MKRLLAVLVLLVLLAVAGGGAALWWVRSHEDDPLPEKRASSTDEFVPKEPPTTRSARFVRNEPWPLYGYDAARTRYGAPFRHRPPYRGVWSFRAGNILEFPPVVAYDRVIFTQQRGRLFALRTKDGKIAWRKHFHRCAAASPAAGSSTVFVALMQPYPCRRQPRSQSGEVVAIRVRGGKILWRWKRTGAVESSPLLRRRRPLLRLVGPSRLRARRAPQAAAAVVALPGRRRGQHVPRLRGWTHLLRHERRPRVRGERAHRAARVARRLVLVTLPRA